MAAQLTVDEASATYASAMRNVQPAGNGICGVCKTFIDAGHSRCYRCSQSAGPLGSIVPITYSEHGAQMHTALWSYKNSPDEAVKNYATVRLTAILWRFLDAHEACVVRDVGLGAFDVVCTVPSSTPEADDARGRLRQIVRSCRPIADRFERLLRPTGEVTAASREFHQRRYSCAEDLSGRAVLLIDDTWTSGGHAQSAGHALLVAGATRVGAVVIGRHLRRSWKVTEDGQTSGDLLDALPHQFDWSTCAVH